MKKFLALVLVVVLALSMVACAGTTSNEKVFKVGAIYINSKNDTAGYTYAHHNGITTAMKSLGMYV